MQRAIYSGRDDAWRDVCPQPELYIGPRKRLATVDCPGVAVEDLAKTDTWLWLNETVREGTRLLYDRVASYAKITSEKARRLERLSEISQSVCMSDVAPFFEEIANLYTTWRYISRSVIGYPHYYAFAGGHAEIHNGNIVSSLDYDLLTDKVSPHCKIDRSPALAQREVVQVQAAQSDLLAYSEKRTVLFDKKKTAQPIITGLADLVHAFDSRRSAVLDFRCDGAVVITNLDTYARWYRANGFELAGTYAKPPNVKFATRVVFAEPPIVYTHRRLHIEMSAPVDCTAIDVRGDCKVDLFLSGRAEQERADVDRFCRLLLEKQS